MNQVFNSLGPMLLAGAMILPACATGGSTTPAEGQPALNGDPEEASRQLAFELLSRGEWDGALGYIDRLRAEDPDDVTLLTWRGIALREKGLVEDATTDLQQALKLEPNRADAHSALGVTYEVRRMPDDAERHHRKATELQPENPSLLNNLGFSLFLHGKAREAVPILERAVRSAPTNGRMRMNLGFAYAEANDFPRAAREFDRGGTPSESRNNLAYAYERRGDLNRAFELYADALRLDPTLVKARINLLHVARETGKDMPADLVTPATDAQHEETVGPSPRPGTVPGQGFETNINPSKPKESDS